MLVAAPLVRFVQNRTLFVPAPTQKLSSFRRLFAWCAQRQCEDLQEQLRLWQSQSQVGEAKADSRSASPQKACALDFCRFLLRCSARLGSYVRFVRQSCAPCCCRCFPPGTPFRWSSFDEFAHPFVCSLAGRAIPAAVGVGRRRAGAPAAAGGASARRPAQRLVSLLLFLLEVATFARICCACCSRDGVRSFVLRALIAARLIGLLPVLCCRCCWARVLLPVTACVCSFVLRTSIVASDSRLRLECGIVVPTYAATALIIR